MPYFVYSRRYNFEFMGIEKLHPFDGTKFSKAWREFSRSEEFKHSDHCNKIEICDDFSPLTLESMALIHDKKYLASLRQSKEHIARIVEIPIFKYLSLSLLHKRLIEPCLYACQGTLIATHHVLNEGGIAMNFGGGFHHAFSDHGEGFCFFADAAMAIEYSRAQGNLKADDLVLMIDLDAHRGNGFESFYVHDPYVNLFDMYNASVYPGMKSEHEKNDETCDYDIPLQMSTDGTQYLRQLKQALPQFLKAFSHATFIIYNAGTDIYDKDRLGGLNVSYDQVLERDVYVLQQLQSLGVPSIVLTSGGYSKHSYQFIAEMARQMIRIF